ncbi:MAG TPA: NAD(P)H-quinone oxidoreductase [Candidatus Polarisedimenticolaceae bacterium]
MRAVVIPRSGGPEVLEIREVPEPSFGPREVSVRVRATALNRADLLQRRGQYPAPPGETQEIPGLEFAGEIEAVGALVQGYAPGDRVMGILGGGGCAEKVVVHERMCLRVPPSLRFEQAAAVPEAFLTAFDALIARGGLVAGETVVVTAAASGVGTAVAAIAKASGARVLATARTPDKRRRLESLGVDGVFDPGDASIGERLRFAASGDGPDLAVDFVGASSWPWLVEALAVRGRLVVVGTLSGSKVAFDLGVLLRKRLTVVGTVLRSRPAEEKMTLTQAFARSILPMLATGRLSPIVDRVVPISEIRAAHAALERNETFGKIVLAWD